MPGYRTGCRRRHETLGWEPRGSPPSEELCVHNLHLDQDHDILSQRWSAALGPRSRFAPPVTPEKVAIPAQHGVRLHNDQRVFPRAQRDKLAQRASLANPSPKPRALSLTRSDLRRMRSRAAFRAGP